MMVGILAARLRIIQSGHLNFYLSLIGALRCGYSIWDGSLLGKGPSDFNPDSKAAFRRTAVYVSRRTSALEVPYNKVTSPPMG